MDEIIDHRRNGDEVSKSQGNLRTKIGTLRKRKTILGWGLLLQWEDDTRNWVKLKDLKDLYLIELMEFARLKNIEDVPAFIWWTPYVKRKVNVIIQRTRLKYWEHTHKYGIGIPKSIEEAKDIGEENDNILWMDAV